MRMFRSRRLSCLVAVALLAGPWFSPAYASDTQVVIKRDLKGSWEVPDGPWDGRAVILLHGFADDMDCVGDLCKHLAQMLARNGIASLRIDFRGEGDRKRTVIESTFLTRIEDAEAAHEFLIRQPHVKADHLGCIGWSLGGATAMEILGRHPLWFRTAVLWSTLPGDLETFIMSRPGAAEAVRNGVSTYDAGWKKITTYRAYYESFHGINLNHAISKYPGASLTVRGSMDFVPNGDPDLMRYAPGLPREALVIGGADHTFNAAVDPNNALAQRVIQVTADWLGGTL